MLGDPGAAAFAALETLVSALAEAYRYPGGSGAQAWVYRRALPRVRGEIRRLRLRGLWAAQSHRLTRRPPPISGPPIRRALQTLGEADRLQIGLHLLLGWPVAAVAALLGVGEAQAAREVHQAEAGFAAALASQAHPAAANPDDLSPAELLQAALPAPEWTAQDLDLLAQEVESQAARRRRRQARSAALQEAGLVAVAVLAAVFLLSRPAARSSPPASTTTAQKTGLLQPSPIARSTALAADSPFDRQAAANPSPTLELGRAYTVEPGDTLASISSRLDVPVRDLLRLNRLQPGMDLPPGRTLLLAAPPDPPLTPPSPLPAWPPALTRASSSAEIASRLQAHYFMQGTYWFDAQVSLYGPPGYLGSPRVYHVQAWQSGPDRPRLLVMGLEQGEPDAVLLRVGSTDFLAQPINGWALFHPLLPYQQAYNQLMDRFSPFDDILLAPVTGTGITGFTYQANAAGELQGGLPTLQVDQIHADTGQVDARLWLDPASGLVVRRQQFGGRDGFTLLWEYRLARLVYNRSFPADLFDPRLPWRGGFAQDETGQPLAAGQAASLSAERPAERALLIPVRPPAGFDPARSRLSFQFTQDFSLPPVLLPFGFPPVRGSPAMYPAEIFADAYYLGDVEFIDPWTAVCSRSADGLHIAFSSDRLDPGQNGSVLAWFSLRDLSKVRRLSLNGFLGSFALSPNGSRLAVFTYSQSGALSVVDTATGQTAHLLSVEDAASLVWSPDGRYLALIATGADLHSELVVIQVSSGQIVQRSPYDGSVPLPPGSQVARWQVNFPVSMGNLEACAAQPGS